MIIYHVALASDWEQAKAVGSYRISTRGRTLDDEGFIHASYADQVAGVARTFYRGVEEPLLVLSIDTALLSSEVIAENTGGGIELFPHIYGPVPVSAVVATGPLPVDPSTDATVSLAVTASADATVSAASAEATAPAAVTASAAGADRRAPGA